MTAELKQFFVTPEEYLVLERASDYKSEYYSGEIVAMSGASARHETIIVNLTAHLHFDLHGKPCRPKGGNLRVRVRKSNYVYPDLTVTCGEPRFADMQYLDTFLNPTVVFEILSESTQSLDLGYKRRLYQQIESLEHYVVLHQDTAHVEVFTRHQDVEWQVHTATGLESSFELAEIGLTLALADIYEDISFA